MQIKVSILNPMSPNEITSISAVGQRIGLLNNAYFNSKAFIWINWVMNLLLMPCPSVFQQKYPRVYKYLSKSPSLTVGKLHSIYL